MREFKGKPQRGTLRIIPLGGAGSVTKNMHVYEYDNHIVVVDCGIGFPDESMLGVDLIIPDISYLLSRRAHIRGILITHAHEDHMGALGYILPQLPVPVFATPLAAGMIEARLKDMRISAEIHDLPVRKPFRLGAFTVEAVHVTHSVPEAVNIAIACPAGVVFHAADFKFDWTPVSGAPTDAAAIAQLGNAGIDVLLSDCLRSEKSGYTLSERVVEDTFELEAVKTAGKLIITTASSNISRMEQAVTVAVRHERKIAFAGRSVETSVQAAKRIGYLAIPHGSEIEVDHVSSYPANRVLVIAAGSQGQPESALARMAHGQHKIQIQEHDTVIFSADPIPGYEQAVHTLIDILTKRGARVLYSDVLEDIHVSGHAAQAELALMMNLTRPKYLIPIGGTFRHMKQYALLAASMGYNENTIFLIEEGQVMILKDHTVSFGERIPLKNVMVDSLGNSESNIVLRDRQVLAQDGIVIAVVPLDQRTGEVAGDIDLVSRGFVEFAQGNQLRLGAQKAIGMALASFDRDKHDWRYLRKKIIDELATYLFRRTKKRPLVLPIVMEV